MEETAKPPKKCKIRIDGAVDYDERTNTFFEPNNGVEYNFEGTDAAFFGNTFTPRAAAQLIFEKVAANSKEGNQGEDPVLAIEFGRDSLLRILSQKGCEAIRFAFSKTLDDNGKISEEISLVAMGLDENGILLKPHFFDKNAIMKAGETPPIVEEKGNKVTTSVILKQMGKIDSAVDPSTKFTYNSFIKAFSKSFSGL